VAPPPTPALSRSPDVQLHYPSASRRIPCRRPDPAGITIYIGHGSSFHIMHDSNWRALALPMLSLDRRVLACAIDQMAGFQILYLMFVSRAGTPRIVAKAAIRFEGRSFADARPRWGTSTLFRIIYLLHSPSTSSLSLQTDNLNYNFLRT
jgi:hypothetical protein